MPHSLITVAIPFPAHRYEATTAALDRIGNPFRRPFRDLLDRSRIIHFASVTTVPSEEGTDTAHLMIEMSADGDSDTALGVLAEAVSDALPAICDSAGIDLRERPAASVITDPRYRLAPSSGWGSPAGLVFSGTPGMSVPRILDEAELAQTLSALINVPRVAKEPSALDKLKHVREAIEVDGRFSTLLKADAAPFLGGEQRGVWQAVGPAIGAFIRKLGWPALLVAAIFVAALALTSHWKGNDLAHTISVAVHAALYSVIALAICAAGLYLALRRRETTDLPDDATPDAALVREIMRRENTTIGDSDNIGETRAAGAPAPNRWPGEKREAYTRAQGTQVVQNHVFAISTMKSGWLRRLTLRLGFFAIETLAGLVYRPGFLGPLGTIHFARWVLLPNTNQLLFYSNYSGSWESYLEDFITNAHQGLTAVWGNTIGFPRVVGLFNGGATDGDRFKRWARRQQFPTRAWYCAYPHLTTASIRVNAALRQGLAGAATESEARDWLSCFGSAPPTGSKLEADDIQALLFSGMGRLPHACALVVGFSADAATNRKWLGKVGDLVTSAKVVPRGSARIVALSASGLVRLGVSERTIGSFPTAFQHGMHAEWRARLLGDIGEDAPEQWRWGGSEANAADAILLIYAECGDALKDLISAERRWLGDSGLVERAAIVFDKTERNGREHFGFVDGISQPIVRGTPRALKYPSEVDHLMEPGEFILGYPDNRGQLPPTPIVAATEDAGGTLPTVVAAMARQRPDFAMSEANMPRDLGRNGSFLVVRQLEQNVKAFEAFLDGAEAQLKASSQPDWINKHPDVPLRDWIAAKMLGRWKDGASMARHPAGPPSAEHSERRVEEGTPTTKKASTRPDNRFRYGEDDPSGFNCPLGSHIRRANPRDSFVPGSADQLAITNRHRLLRVGRTYTRGEERGLVFMCLNADIERQFEFVQQTWCLATQFHGLRDEADPILGRNVRTTTMIVPTPNGPIQIEHLRKFIAVRGGGYFFLPGRRALNWLARAQPTNTSPLPASAQSKSVYDSPPPVVR